MAKLSAAIRTDQVQEDGKVNIKIRVYHQGTRYIPTKFYILKEQFNIPDGVVRKTHSQSGFINKELKLLIAKYETQIMKMDDLDTLTVSQLVKRLKGKKKQTADMVQMLQSKADRLKKKEPDKNTWYTIHNTVESVKAFTGRESVMLQEVDSDFLDEFVDWHLTKGNKINSAALYLRNIRAIYNEAIKEKLVSADFYPFRDWNIPTEPPKKRSLKERQIKKIYHAKLDDLNEQRARDMFMLIFFLLGINTKDLFQMKPEQYVGGRIYYSRAKTKKEYSILVHPEAEALVEKYRDTKGEWLLNLHETFNSTYTFMRSTNKFLKRFTPSLLKTKEKVTTYYARHSWATIAYNNGVTKDVVTLALGHGSKTVTDLYIDFNLKGVDEANRKVIDLVV